MSDAKMWTDGRYYIQGERQLEQGWQMEKMEKGVPSWFEFLKTNLSANQVIGMDYSQYPASALDARTKFFTEASLEVKNVPNLVDMVWGDERPARPVKPVMVLEAQFSGKSSLDK